MSRRNIDVFKQTMDVYLRDPVTEVLCTSGTTVYNRQKLIDKLFTIADFGKRPTNIEVIAGDTVETGRLLVESNPHKTTAILNFADALMPGGLVWSGANTQEEHICRCSNLYASLTTDVADKKYYQKNEAYNRQRPGRYTDNIIYSKNVMFFRSGKDYSMLRDSYQMDVITCPAPSARLNPIEAQFIISNRAENIIKCAVMNGVDELVLGAWGCGAFGQSPVIVAKSFKSALKKYPYFDNVIFAIRNCRDDSSTGTTSNYSVFKEIIMNGS